ncbi:signal peptide peptidase SppA [Paenibacillus popilliae]|uniref:Periplasmic serine protease n=1 Tax=Paenibacillus popilliae ATCC 14706 TaxID=1212764 RepID=M9M4N6_PAEPP|nr:signal peptide peptidase SppA [Paenibacillus popilliae]GAC42253.1 periplasmic serine protease [Paenibacillus popilliae ATCC 14706]
MNNKQVIAVLAIVIMSFSSLFVYLSTNSTMETNHLWTERVVEGGGSTKIAQIFVEGVISPELDETRQSVLLQLDAAIEDPQVKGIVLAVNTPGGDVVTSDHIYQKIIQAKKSGKVVAVSMGSIAASGGYYISTPAHKIFANPLTVTGSIGVIMSFSNYKELADKIGYHEINIRTGEYKSMGNPLSEFTQETKHIYQSIVNESYEQFVNIIINNRNLDRSTVVKLADGRVFSGTQAKSLGLVDEMGNVEDATNYVKKKLGLHHCKLVQYERKSSFFTGLLSVAASPVSTLERQIQEIKATFENSTPRILYMVK